MNILQEIMAHKAKELQEVKALTPIKKLEQSIFFETPCVSMQHYLRREGSSGIIAEFKRRSPSRGDINPYAKVEEVSIGYMQAGAAALSVLTDAKYFGGNLDDLRTARKFNYCPILRKDFMMDEYQVIEAKSAGADVILLIAAALEAKQCAQLAQQAKELGMEVLLEIHDASEIDAYVNEHVDLVGVNNRNLKNFDEAISVSERIASLLPADKLKVSESALSDAQQIKALRALGYEGFLIGGHFMEHAQPQQRCRAMVQNLQSV